MHEPLEFDDVGLDDQGLAAEFGRSLAHELGQLARQATLLDERIRPAAVRTTFEPPVDAADGDPLDRLADVLQRVEETSDLLRRQLELARYYADLLARR